MAVIRSMSKDMSSYIIIYIPKPSTLHGVHPTDIFLHAASADSLKKAPQL